MMRYAFLAGALVCAGLGLPQPGLAQVGSSPVQNIGVAKVELLARCPEFSSRNLVFQGVGTPHLGIFAPILGGLLGDLAGAGLNAVASALETASQERAIGAEGRTNFEFYTLNTNNTRDTNNPSIAVPRLGTELTCLSLEIPGPHISDADGLANWPPAQFTVNGRVVSTAGGGDLTPEQAEALTEQFALKTATLLRLEAEIVRMQDGFYIRPVYIRYAQRLDGTPSNKSLPSELHVKLATPSSASNGAAVESVFAVARIPLPKLKPGDVWWAEQISAQSVLLPFRADDGTTAALKLALAAATARAKAEEDVAAAEVQMAHALGARYDGRTITGCVAIPCPSYLPSLDTLKTYSLEHLVTWARLPASKVPAAPLAALDTAESARATSVLAIDQNAGRIWSVAGRRATAVAGSTTLEARLVMTRSANKFGLAIASALKKQEAPLSSAVSGIVTKEHPGWTQAQSDLATALLAVNHKQQALDRAKAGGEAAAVEAAELALLQAKLDVNLRSSALGRPIPYPELAQ